MNANWEPSHEGWYSRAQPGSTSFTPTRENLLLALTVDTPARQGTLVAALFKPNVAIDGSGRVLSLAQPDIDGISSLAAQVLSLPDTGSFQNQWRIDHPITSRPIYKLHITDGGQTKLTSVYGYEKGNKKLKSNTAGHDELPDALYQLLGLLQEGQQGSESGGNSEVVEAVKALIA
ncbi:hypothetical protein GLOTRDRAFT_121858 [Gloeophyllum trabeum ATCC 11539]|uniref:Uncharacterized protein n=1 Tax=Gloeophyllum trabeum (strain ATCC 11539 / FP-39264 / Madison 617) TaxID=670483 RepID=S7RKL8_GLOTA|nr:uncharacterized protein GLOTRDRAFT_121858 [Gloeophyllum trabeum ATCC 11539]EPQ54925.1 hypothetical protein GLOTRDRAFT_121858 [Gloeophyllum trabeum ATCC 11539]